MKARHSGGCTGNHYGRRDLLRLGALNFVGISLGQYLEAAARSDAAATATARARSCILIWLDGGPSQVDTWDPKPNSAFKPIATRVPGIQISELFPRVAAQIDKISIIRSMRSEENNHGTAHHYAMTGHRPNPAMKFPSLGSIVTKEAGPRGAVPPYVMVPKMNPNYEEHFRGHILGPECDPMSVSAGKPPADGEESREAPPFSVPDLSLPQSVTAEAMDDRKSFLEIVDRRYRRQVERAEHCEADAFRQKAWEMLLSPAVRKAFDLSEESDKTRDGYGRHVAGQSALLARRLVEAGSRFVTASGSGGWDTHTGHDKSVRDRLSNPLDQTLAALLADLADRGLLDSTIVLVMGEFGRTPDYNAKLGRDHWPNCWSVLLGGGGIACGRIVGRSDEKGAEVADRMVTIGDVFATIYKAFGIDWNKTYMHPIGRPLKIANSINDVTGNPIKELV
jgi:hypothetical protein